MLNKFVSNGLRWVSNTSRRFERPPSSYTDKEKTLSDKVPDNRAKAASIREVANDINYAGSIHFRGMLSQLQASKICNLVDRPNK